MILTCIGEGDQDLSYACQETGRVLVYKAQEDAGETSKKPVGPCILSPSGGYPRDIKGHRGSSRVLVLAQEKAMWVTYFVSKQKGGKVQNDDPGGCFLIVF